MPADRPQPVHRVERRHFADADGRDVHAKPDVRHRLFGEPAELVLREMQGGEQRGLAAPGRILRDCPFESRIEALLLLGRERTLHRARLRSEGNHCGADVYGVRGGVSTVQSRN